MTDDPRRAVSSLPPVSAETIDDFGGLAGWTPAAGSKAAELKRLYETAVDRGSVHEGLDVLVRLTELLPDDPHVFLFAAGAFHRFGDLESAFGCADRAFRLGADRAFRLGAASARSMRSEMLARMGRREAALASIRDDLREQPASVDLAVFYADLLLEIGAFKAGRLLLQRTLSIGDLRSAPIYLRLARLSLWRGNPSEAENWAEKACASAPESREALGLRGAAKVLSGRPGQAVGDLEAALARPEDLEARVWRAEARRRMGDLTGAMSDIAEVLNSWGTALAPRAMRCLILMDQPDLAAQANKEDQARGVINDALDLLPSGFKTPYWEDEVALREALGMILRRLGGNFTNHGAVLDADGELSLRERPPTVRHLCRSAQQTINYHRPDRVLARFAALEKRYPDEAVVYTHRGEIQLWLGDYEDAGRSFEKAQALDPQARWPYIGLFASAALRGRYAEAAEWDRRQAFIKDFDVLGPGRTFHCYAGEALRNQGRHEEAKRSLERALELDPQRLGAWINLALVQLALGEEAQARGCFDLLRERARPLVADAAAGSKVDLSSGEKIKAAGIRAVLERCLLMMRGNRSSLINTYFDGDALRIVPPLPQWVWRDSWRAISGTRPSARGS